MRNDQHTPLPAYGGPVQAVIFDWAGTMIDFGSCAPATVFVEAFHRHGIEISIEDARVPMGLPKWDHIKAVLALPHIAERGPFTDADVDRVYETFLPIQTGIITAHDEPIDGVPELLARLRARGIKIGSTTGYPRVAMDALIPAAARKGIDPAHIVAADDLERGRPAPLMIWDNLVKLNVSPAAAVIKVDDTKPGIDEGLAAGCWTVALAGTGNEIAMSLKDWKALSDDARADRLAKARASMAASGAHYVIDSAAGLDAVIDDVEARLQAGEQP